MISKLNQFQRVPYFDTYLALVEQEDLVEELLSSKDALEAYLINLPDERLSYSYGKDKWTIAQVVLHCIETEIIFNYRALTIARELQSPTLPGFDENLYAREGSATVLTTTQLMTYFDAVRTTTLHLINTITSAQMQKVGKASGHDIQVEALFYVSSGHVRHHLNVLRERY